MFCRGIRGATTVDLNEAEAILSATRELLEAIVASNDANPEDFASIFFTTTTDINAAFPARAARDLGWNDTALICAHEMAVPGSLPMCIRVLIHWNTQKSQREIVNVYLHGARQLRADRGGMQ